MLTNMCAFEAFTRDDTLAACVAFIRERAPYALKKGFVSYIYRGSYNSMRWFVHTPEQVGQRRSANTTNYCNLIVNRHWPAQGFPYREIICSNSVQTTENYGTLYYVLPAADANMGICPKSDFWYLDTLPESMVVSDVNDIIGGAHASLYTAPDGQGHYVLQDNYKSIDDSSYETLEAAFAELDAAPEEFWTRYLGDSTLWKWDRGGRAFLRKYRHSGKPLMEWLTSTILDPVKAGMRHAKFSEFPESKLHGQEVWFDSPCLLVCEESYEELMAAARKEGNS